MLKHIAGGPLFLIRPVQMFNERHSQQLSLTLSLSRVLTRVAIIYVAALCDPNFTALMCPRFDSFYGSCSDLMYFTLDMMMVFLFYFFPHL